MSLVNIGNERYRDLMADTGSRNAPADSLGFGTNNANHAAGDTRLGAGGASYWKTGGDVTVTTGGDGTTSPWYQFAATFDTTEANDDLGELGISAGTLDGTDPAGNDDENLVAREAIGPFAKDNRFELEGRVRVDHLHSSLFTVN